MKTFVKDKLQVEIFENRTLMGESAAKDISAKIKPRNYFKDERQCKIIS